MRTRPLNLLVVCACNSARSLLAEALFNALGGGRVQVFSAGSRPAGDINAFALELLDAQGLEHAHLRSKSWEEFARSDAPAPDLLLTLCREAAQAPMPVWQTQPLASHWEITDPATFDGSEQGKRDAFMRAYAQLAERILTFFALSFESMSRDELQRHLDEIGRHGAAADVPEIALLPEDEPS